LVFLISFLKIGLNLRFNHVKDLFQFTGIRLADLTNIPSGNDALIEFGTSGQMIAVRDDWKCSSVQLGRLRFKASVHVF